MNIFEIEVHPVCSVWPMMNDEELESLAQSIKVSGLRRPIVVKDGVLIDGKCRLAACKLAGVTPETVELGDDIDIEDYNICVNALRASYSLSQMAMGKAMLTDEGENEGSSVKKARYVLAANKPLAESIIKGYGHLEEAYVEVRQQQAASKLRAEKTAWLRRENPALLEMVQDEKLDIDAAIALESGDTALPWEDKSEGDSLKAAFHAEYESALAGMSKTASQQTRKVIEDLSEKLLDATHHQIMEMRRQQLDIGKAFSRISANNQ